MPSDTSERRAVKQTQAGAPPPEPEHLPCPRCESTNTKFCYYNNYNFSQPRHFCKACRRYWTHGGTLRDIPVGGGSRKNAKRSRVSATSTTGGSTTTNTTLVSSPHEYRHHMASSTSPLLASLQGVVDYGGSLQVGYMGDGKTGLNMCGGSFTSLLNTQGAGGILALGGMGVGVEEMGFGHGRAAWPFPGMSIGLGDGGAMIGNTWQLESGDW